MEQCLRERDAHALGAVGTRHQDRTLSCRPSRRSCPDTHLSSSGEEPCVSRQLAGHAPSTDSCSTVPTGLAQKQQLRPSAPQASNPESCWFPPHAVCSPFHVHSEAELSPHPPPPPYSQTLRLLQKPSDGPPSRARPPFSMLSRERPGVRWHRPQPPPRQLPAALHTRAAPHCDLRLPSPPHARPLHPTPTSLAPQPVYSSFLRSPGTGSQTPPALRSPRPTDLSPPIP